MVDELLCYVLREKIQIYFLDFFEFLTRRTLHSSSSSIDSYGDYLFAIFMEIYHELSEYLYYYSMDVKIWKTLN